MAKPTFTTDYACAVHVILLVDHYDLAYCNWNASENSYLFHGQTFCNFEETHFWKNIQNYSIVSGCQYINQLWVVQN